MSLDLLQDTYVQLCEIEGDYMQSPLKLLPHPNEALYAPQSWLRYRQPAKAIYLACSTAAISAGSDSQLAAHHYKGPLVHEAEYMHHVIGHWHAPENWSQC